MLDMLVYIDLRTRWESTIYIVNNRSAESLHTTINKGREGNAYLNYIMEAYDDLRDVTVFIHAHRSGNSSWHTDAPGHDNVVSLKSLQLDYVLQNGYANLRCRHKPGCPDAIQPFRQGPVPEEITRENAMRVVESNMIQAWEYIFPSIPVPHEIGAACCAQFAVTKQQIRKRPREDYERMFQWLMESPLDDAISGRIFEYLWHIIFGREAQQYDISSKGMCIQANLS